MGEDSVSPSAELCSTCFSLGCKDDQHNSPVLLLRVMALGMRAEIVCLLGHSGARKTSGCS